MRKPVTRMPKQRVHTYSPVPDQAAIEKCFGTLTPIGRTNGPCSQASVGPTVTFPGRKFDEASSFAEAYFAQITAAGLLR